MKSSTAVILFGIFLAFLVMPENIFAAKRPFPTPGPPGPHEEYQECGAWCVNTCQKPYAERGPCILMCNRANFCVDGYIREYEGGPCILPSDCPTRTRANTA